MCMCSVSLPPSPKHIHTYKLTHTQNSPSCSCPTRTILIHEEKALNWHPPPPPRYPITGGGGEKTYKDITQPCLTHTHMPTHIASTHTHSLSKNFGIRRLSHTMMIPMGTGQI